MNLNPAHLYSSLTVNTAVGDLHTYRNPSERPRTAFTSVGTANTVYLWVTDDTRDRLCNQFGPPVEMLGDDLSGHTWPHGIS